MIRMHLLHLSLLCSDSKNTLISVSLITRETKQVCGPQGVGCEYIAMLQQMIRTIQNLNVAEMTDPFSGISSPSIR